ncbi:MAG: helix-turn-helix transcriptional regulator, partial [Beijerinckiaceae bacterium]|nr:helix-turn-helix transcriptional regulator [Beijerinckiaceae bacterium]
MDPQLIDRIYECSLVPELWPGVLDEMKQIAGGRGGTLWITKADIQFWSAAPASREAAAIFVKEGWFWRGQVVARLFAARHAGFLTDLDLFTRDELDQEPIYRDIWSKYGIGWSVATAIPIPTGENVTFVLTRQTERGPVEPVIVAQLNELRPHLARSALLSARLQLERARIASETLAAVGLPALVLDERGKVLAANALVEDLKDYVQWRAFDRISLKDRSANNLLHDAVATITLAGGAVRSFPVRDTGAEAMMVAHVIPIRLSARDIFVRCAAALVLTPVTLPQAPPVELVQSLFDLTPAEARVARSLASGKTVDDIATDGGISPNTIRTHVRGVLEKTGCNRQADIVALLTAIS